MEEMSKWYRWDMHIHTPNTQMHDGYTDQNGQRANKEGVWKKYCQDLNKYGASALGITDYFSVKNFFDLQKHRREWGLNSDIVIFPNIEVRLNDLVSKKRAEKGKTSSNVNVHLLFSPDADKQTLEKFLRELKVNGPSGRKLNFVDDLPEIIKGDQVGRMPTSSEMRSALQNTFGTNYSESVLIMIPNSDDGINLKDGNGYASGRQFIQDDVDLIQAREKKAFEDREWLLKPTNSYGKVFPAVTGCDAHRLEQMETFPPSSYTWIKAERTFEGLKQVLYEPGLRVRIQENMPEPPVKSKIIETLELNNSTFGTKTLHFSDGLNTIIGGRSSGKSVLLSLIGKLASNADKFKSNNKSYNALIERLSRGCTIRYADGTVGNRDGQIRFIYQDGLQEIARTPSARKEFIEETLVNLADINQIRNEASKYRSQKHDAVVGLVSQLATLDQKIEDKESKIGSQQDAETLNKNIQKLAEDVKKRQEQAKNIDQVAVDEMLERGRALQQSAKATTADVIELVQLRDENLVQLNPQINSYTRQIIKETVLSFQEKIASFNRELQSKVDELIQEKQNTLSQMNSDIQALKESTLYSSYQEQQKRSPELQKFQKSLSEQRKLLDDITNDKDELKDLQNTKSEVIRQIINELDFEDALYSRDIYETDDKTLNFKVVSSIDVDKVVEMMSSVFKPSSVAFKDKVEALHIEGGGLNIEDETTIDAESMHEMMIRCLDLGAKLPSNETPYRSGSSLYAWLEAFSNMEFLKIDYRITYNGQDFSDMSEGKQAFILLMMQLNLDEDDKPFLIDQPEDELDNKAIYDDLVSYLREQKQQRQLFVVTHNANVLVGGDSECVTLANELIDDTGINGHQFTYQQGSIENPEMQASICEVLEGGQRAFKKREQRYTFSRSVS